MVISIVNANSGTVREYTFEGFHGGKKSPWAELRFGVAGVYNFSLNTGWISAKKDEPQDWHVDLADLEKLLTVAQEQGIKFKVALVQAPERTPAKPRSARGKPVAPPQQRRLFE